MVPPLAPILAFRVLPGGNPRTEGDNQRTESEQTPQMPAEGGGSPNPNPYPNPNPNPNPNPAMTLALIDPNPNQGGGSLAGSRRGAPSCARRYLPYISPSSR